MGTVRLNISDVELLYSFPKPATDLETIVWSYTFINRTGPPSYDELKSCLTKGMKIGMIQREGERFFIEKKWYHVIHLHDDTAENEIDSMLEFQERIVNVDLRVKIDTESDLTEAEYKSILAKLK